MTSDRVCYYLLPSLCLPRIAMVYTHALEANQSYISSQQSHGRRIGVATVVSWSLHIFPVVPVRLMRFHCDCDTSYTTPIRLQYYSSTTVANDKRPSLLLPLLHLMYASHYNRILRRIESNLVVYESPSVALHTHWSRNSSIMVATYVYYCSSTTIAIPLRLQYFLYYSHTTAILLIYYSGELQATMSATICCHHYVCLALQSHTQTH